MKGVLTGAACMALLLLLIPLVALGAGKGAAAQPTVASTAKTTAAAGNGLTFTLLDAKTGVVGEIGAYDYVCGVVAAEMPVTFHTEALKAQAVASYTYAVYRREYNRAHPDPNSAFKGADLSTDPKVCKAYLSKEDAKTKFGGNFARDWAKISGAVSAVSGKVMTYDGKPICAVFFSLSSGMTESSEDVWGAALPYLVSVKSEGDKLVSGWESDVTCKQAEFKRLVTEAYSDAAFDSDPSKWLTEIKRSQAGGVIQANLCGKTLHGEDIRKIFSLRSANFTLTYKDGAFVFDVKGYGHGVGMSQYGADYMAAQGKTWQDILTWYYTGIKIEDYNEKV